MYYSHKKLQLDMQTIKYHVTPVIGLYNAYNEGEFSGVSSGTVFKQWYFCERELEVELKLKLLVH